MRSLWWGGLLAPLAAPLVAFLVMFGALITKDGWSTGTQDWEIGIAFVTVFILPVSYLAMWIVGLPFIFWLRSLSRLTQWNVCLGALASSAIGVAILDWIDSPSHNGQLDQLIFGFLIIGGLALCVALAFCWIVKVPFKSGTSAERS